MSSVPTSRPLPSEFAHPALQESCGQRGVEQAVASGWDSWRRRLYSRHSPLLSVGLFRPTLPRIGVELDLFPDRGRDPAALDVQAVEFSRIVHKHARTNHLMLGSEGRGEEEREPTGGLNLVRADDVAGLRSGLLGVE